MSYIVLTHSGKTETFRMDRLLDLFKMLKKETKSHIVRLHDHEGNLEVYVKSKELSYLFFDDIQECWESLNEVSFSIIFEDL
jgi:hypothetical protein